MAVRAPARQPAEGPGARAAHRADRRRRGAHLRHGQPVPAGRHLFAASASSTSPRTSARCCPTARRATARSSRKASPRPARIVVVDGGGDAATACTACAMLPFYIYYSMFGFQRVGDLIWAAADQRARGFLLGATAGPHDARRRRPAAPGRHAATWSPRRCPTASAYDPAFAGEIAVIVDHGMREMLERAAGRLLLRHADERELRAAVAAGRGARGRAARHVPLRRCGARRRRRAGARCSARARSCAR